MLKIYIDLAGRWFYSFIINPMRLFVLHWASICRAYSPKTLSKKQGDTFWNIFAKKIYGANTTNRIDTPAAGS